MMASEISREAYYVAVDQIRFWRGDDVAIADCLLMLGAPPAALTWLEVLDLVAARWDALPRAGRARSA